MGNTYAFLKVDVYKKQSRCEREQEASDNKSSSARRHIGERDPARQSHWIQVNCTVSDEQSRGEDRIGGGEAEEFSTENEES